jgi:hypothetical protein
MGGLYRIADALKALNGLENPEYMALQALDAQLHRERLELDRRALAIQYAKDAARIDFRTDKDPNPPPEHERVLEAARAYYAFLSDGPSVQDEVVR